MHLCAIMVSLTGYGGIGEIGGNKLLLEDKGAKIYLDFGESFNFGEGFFYDYLAPRTANGLEVYFEFDLLPKVSGLYAKRQLELTELAHCPPEVDGVIISHSHSDHIGHLNLIDEGIPIHMGHGTHKITELYHQLYPAFFDIGEHSDLRPFRSGEKFKVKHLEIKPVHVEHSIPGAYGFIIDTSEGAVIYTGDFRLHGPRSDMSREFIEKAKAAEPCAILCEGTRMGSEPEHNFTEAEVEKKVSDIIAKSKGLVLAYFSMSNIDRFLSFYKAALRNGRTLVIDTRLAHIIQNLRDKIMLPDVMNDKHIRVYFRLAKSRTFSGNDYAKWEREYAPKMITYQEISKNPSSFLMHMNFNRLMELVYLKPKEADFIYSMSEHFLEGEENKDQRAVWENWMEHFSISFHKAHCSGHASKADIAEFIKEVGPELVIPIHTEKPEEFSRFHGNVLIPEKGKRLEIKA
jgi:ribonuclease J